MLIIPAIDMINGECVRLKKGEYGSKKVYEKDPIIQAKKFEDAGLTNLHLVDLDGAKSGHVVNWKAVEAISLKTNLKVDFGGGVKTTSELERLFSLGVKQVTCGSIAVKDRALVLSWLEKYGDKLILGADCKNEKIATSGWLEDNDIDVIEFIKAYREKGFLYCISTDIAQDGMLSGPSFSMYDKILKAVPDIRLIASGGIKDVDDLIKLKEQKLFGAIVGAAYYEGRINLKQMGELNNAC